MHRPPQTRRPSLRPVLALLGVTGAALAALPAPRAQAIGGGAASVSQATSPREVSGAAPTVSLFQTSASSYASTGGGSNGNTSPSEVTPAAGGSASGGGQEESETPRRRRSAAPEDNGRSAGRQRAERRREREASEPTARSERRREPAPSGGGKAVADTSKGGKETLVAPARGPIFTLSAGYQTRYIYHGLDIISFNSSYRNNFSRVASGQDQTLAIRAESSGIYFTDASVEYKGFRGGVGYVQAVDPTVPYFQNAGDIGSPNSFPGDNVQLYREVNIHLDYTVTLVPRWLDATVGFNTFFFPNTDFKGTAYQGEIPIRLTFTRIPYVRPSFSYFRYISDYKKFGAGNLNGNYVEFRLDGSVPIIDKPNFGLTIAPYAAFGYNINYLKFSGNDDIGGWNTFETGVKVPVRLGKHFTVTPFGNYGKNLNGANVVANSFAESTAEGSGGSRSFGEQTRFWGGVNLSYAF